MRRIRGLVGIGMMSTILLATSAMAAPASPAAAAHPAKPAAAVHAAPAAHPSAKVAVWPAAAKPAARVAVHAPAGKMVTARTSTGKQVTYNCSKAGNHNKSACKG